MTAKALQFQILGATTKDVAGAFQITLFGSTEDGKSVSAAVTGFRPYFYIELPDTWTSKDRVAYEQFLGRQLTEAETTAVTLTVERHKSFWDFTSNKVGQFLKVEASSKRLWTKIRDICQDKETALPIPYGTTTLRVFEANIDPLLRTSLRDELALNARIIKAAGIKPD